MNSSFHLPLISPLPQLIWCPKRVCAREPEYSTIQQEESPTWFAPGGSFSCPSPESSWHGMRRAMNKCSTGPLPLMTFTIRSCRPQGFQSSQKDSLTFYILSSSLINQRGMIVSSCCRFLFTIEEKEFWLWPGNLLWSQMGTPLLVLPW